MWNKYRVQKKQIYQNGGWVDTDPLQTRTGEKIGEYDSFSGCSGYDILYRWQPADPNEDWVCSGYTKYYKEYYQVSYDNGSTWANVVPEQTRTGDFIEDYSWDCGYDKKFMATYSGGTTYILDCDNSRVLTSGETNASSTSAMTTMTDAAIGYCVYEIGEHAFDNCHRLTGVTIPNSVTTIGEYAFFACWDLPSITIPDSVTIIGGYSFYSCESLTSINIPSSVTLIGFSAFGNCKSLTSVTIPDSITILSSNTFNSCSSLTGVTIPDSVTKIANDVFKGCSGLTTVTIGSGITAILDSAFSGCTSLQSVTIHAVTPPLTGYATFYDTRNCPIYVPAESVNDYKNSIHWDEYSNRIRAIP